LTAEYWYSENRSVADPLLRRIPMVAGLAYIERVRRLPSQLTVTLQPERENTYFLHAIAVLASGEKVGYVTPEVARRYYSRMLDTSAPVSCPARHASMSDHRTSGVELILDFSELSVTPEP
jgi:HIRAN domain-containing protein